MRSIDMCGGCRDISFLAALFEKSPPKTLSAFADLWNAENPLKKRFTKNLYIYRFFVNLFFNGFSAFQRSANALNVFGGDFSNKAARKLISRHPPHISMLRMRKVELFLCTSHA